jgi:hypothetical protein
MKLADDSLQGCVEIVHPVGDSARRIKETARCHAHPKMMAVPVVLAGRQALDAIMPHVELTLD